MTRSDLVDSLYKAFPEFGRHLVDDAVALFFFEISAALQRGERVEIRGMGSFCLRKRASRLGRNPKTGEAVQVSEKWVPFFKAGKELKEVVNLKSYKPNLKSLHSKASFPGLHTHQHVSHS